MIVIDYRQLLDKIDNPPYTLYSAGDRAAWLDECIATSHAFDAEPVKHGRWINTGSGQECSICKEIQYGYDTGRHYCPNCGSKNKDGDSE